MSISGKQIWQTRLSDWVAAHPESQQSGQQMARVRRDWARKVARARVDCNPVPLPVLADLDIYLKKHRID